MTPALKALKLDLDDLSALQLRREWVFGKLAASINDASKAPGHYVEDARNSGQQEDRSQCKLDCVSHVTDVQGRVEHEALN